MLKLKQEKHIVLLIKHGRGERLVKKITKMSSASIAIRNKQNLRIQNNLQMVSINILFIKDGITSSILLMKHPIKIFSKISLK
jgi:hypothetical protein